MRTKSLTQHPLARWIAVPLVPLALAAALLALQGCASSSASSSSAPSMGAALSDGIDMSMTPPNPDPRVGLRAGWFDAGEAIWNLRAGLDDAAVDGVHQSTARPATAGSSNSDLAFTGNYVIQGNYSGFQIWDISNPAQADAARRRTSAPASQSDVSVYRNLLFVSARGDQRPPRLRHRRACTDTVSKERLRGIRIFDITDIDASRSTSPTCRPAAARTRTRW